MTRPPIEQMQGAVPLWNSGRPEPKVGDRVRYRISPECPYRCPGCSVDAHFPEEFGRSGVAEVDKITSGGDLKCKSTMARKGCGADVACLSHNYGLYIRNEPVSFTGFWACLAELEVIEEPEL